MELNELFKSENIGEIIAELKSKRQNPLPDIGKFEKELNPAEHTVCDAIQRPDKRVKIVQPKYS